MSLLDSFEWNLSIYWATLTNIFRIFCGYPLLTYPIFTFYEVKFEHGPDSTDC